MFTLEVARELTRRGHDVAVYTGEPGPLASTIEECGIAILDDPAKCPWKPDIIHGQHHAYAFRAILGFPMTPAILHLHGFLPALEKPFRHPRIRRYLTTAESISRHWSSSYELSPDLFLTIPNHIDLDRFHQKKNPPDQPAKALLYSNANFSLEQLEILRNACAEREITLELAGLCKGSDGILLKPEDLLPKYDLVFAVGRSALEAAACGCGVIPVYLDMAEEMLLPETYKKLRGQNLAPRLFKHHKLSKEWVEMQLLRWNSNLVMQVSEMVRESANLGGTVSLLEKIYINACTEHATHPCSSWEVEMEALEAYFSKQRERYCRSSFFILNRKVETLNLQIEGMKNSLCWQLTAPLRWIDRILRRRNPLEKPTPK